MNATRLLAGFTLALLACLEGVGSTGAWAQSRRSFEPPLEPPVETPLESRPLGLELTQVLGYDSNLLRLGADVPRPATLTERGSAVSRTRGLVFYDQSWSLQHVRLSASAEAIRYTAFSVFDHQALQADGRWDWALGRLWFGTLEAGAQQFLSPFTDVRPFNDAQLIVNRIDRRNQRLTAGLRWAPDWSLLVGVDRLERNNSDPARSSTDLVEQGHEAALRWVPVPDLETELRWRQVDGRYANRAVFTVFGELIPGVVADNGYGQDELSLRVVLDRAGPSRLEAVLGQTQRHFANLTARDFSAPVVRFRYTWQPTVKLGFPISISREFYSVEQLTATFADVRRLALAANWEETAKRRWSLLFDRQWRTFRGDTSAALGLGALASGAGEEVRSDSTNLAGLRLSQELSRLWYVDADLRSERRSSSLASFSYQSRQFFLGLRFVH